MMKQKSREEPYDPVREAERHLEKVRRMQEVNPTPLGEILLKAAKVYLEQTRRENP